MSGSDALKHTIGVRLTDEQFAVVKDLIAQNNMKSGSELLRHLLERECNERLWTWPEYAIITNDDRKARGIRGRGIADE